MKKKMVISVMSKDRPGIIADVTGALLQLEGDVADLNQTVLCGYLTMILGVTFPSDITREDIFASISHVKSGEKFEISVKELPETETFNEIPQPEESYILSLQGPNRKGIVHAVSSICGRNNVNIIDLGTSLQQDCYTMAVQCSIKEATCSLEELRKEFEEYGREANQTIMMQHYDLFRATNEVTLH